jgi:hypothetical protein
MSIRASEKTVFCRVVQVYGYSKNKDRLGCRHSLEQHIPVVEENIHLRPALERHLSSTQQGQELLLTQNEWRTLELMIPVKP